MKLDKLFLTLTTIGGLLVSSDTSVIAGNSTANLTVNATVVANCTVTTATITFPNYDPIVAHASTPDDTTAVGAVTVACTKGTSSTIGLSFGQNATNSPRAMKDSAGNLLSYDLYTNSPGGTVWGNIGGPGTPYTPSPAAAPSKAPRAFNVYGRIPQAQDVPAGSYTDTVIATVNF